MSSAWQVPHGWMEGKIFRMKRDHMGTKHTPNKKGGYDEAPCPFKKGELVKVVMCSRFLDCGITHDLTKVNGYDARVPPHFLELAPDQGNTYDRNVSISENEKRFYRVTGPCEQLPIEAFDPDHPLFAFKGEAKQVGSMLLPIEKKK